MNTTRDPTLDPQTGDKIQRISNTGLVITREVLRREDNYVYYRDRHGKQKKCYMDSWMDWANIAEVVPAKKRETALCGLCDETYYLDDAERIKVHEHPEPQSGPPRDRWLASRLPYERWIVETRDGRAWANTKK